MIREEGFYIVEKKGGFSKTVHFLWIYVKNRKKYFLIDDNNPVLFTEDSSQELNEFKFIKKLTTNRKDLEFKRTVITIKTEFGNHTFEFKSFNFIALYRLVFILLPGIGESLRFRHFVKRLLNDIKQGKFDS
ncbi:hypothetical protein [Roseivirga echinicomitans]|uniref:Uncharacterized protein n=1 Tax=Roseivirga echinicomitans TaxID=296218 RepID=A0A150XEN9_9BACT|nr:hypothetical protein [Roseivirga echinicomitans]KYG77170.1 hypothetical protein AWN68_18225 [Roseivirga echinicomitans]